MCGVVISHILHCPFIYIHVYMAFTHQIHYTCYSHEYCLNEFHYNNIIMCELNCVCTWVYRHTY